VAQAYLYLNSLLYAAIAVWNTVAPQRAASRLGYDLPSESARSEFLTVYGGMQIGLAFLFLILARDPANSRLGLLVSMGFYFPVLSYRVMTGFHHSPAFGLLRGAVVIEALLLLAASVLYLAAERPAH
jgi:hypothetical protein